MPAVQLDAAKANVSLDIGPSADSPGAAAFRDFWGERAETWRLKVLPCLTPALLLDVRSLTASI